jgi:phenylacetate-coenzyme A ligase PaaK-like adenylate-forming protein
MKLSFYRSRSHQLRFYDAWEELSEDQRQEEIFKRLSHFIENSARSVPFYENRLAGFDPRSAHPLKEVPVLAADEVRQASLPSSSLIVAKDFQTINVFQSGGTTGGAKTTLFSCDELDLLDFYNARGFYALGLCPQDKVANLFAVGGLYMTFIHINRMLQQYGCINFPFSNQTATDFIATVARSFQINVFTGIASVVLNVLRSLHEMGVRDLKVEKVFYGGEHFYDADKEEIRQKFGTTLVAAPGYGTVDSWYIGYQCMETPTGVFHAHDDSVYLEIVDEESGLACEPGQTGTMLVTPFVRKLTPIVRYRVGDRAQWLKAPCGCGRTTPLFKLLGRSDDVLRIGFDSVDYAYVQKIATQVPGASGTIQMQKLRLEGKDKLVIRMETDASTAEERGSIQSEFAKKFTQARPSFREFVDKGTVWPLEVICVSMGELPRNPRTGKLKRVIDAIEG